MGFAVVLAVLALGQGSSFAKEAAEDEKKPDSAEAKDKDKAPSKSSKDESEKTEESKEESNEDSKDAFVEHPLCAAGSPRSRVSRHLRWYGAHQFERTRRHRALRSNDPDAV